MRVLWTPIVESIVHKRCITTSHSVTMLLAVIGAVLITQPDFLGFPSKDDMDEEKIAEKYLAYLVALIAGND